MSRSGDCVVRHSVVRMDEESQRWSREQPYCRSKKHEILESHITEEVGAVCNGRGGRWPSTMDQVEVDEGKSDSD